MEPESSRLIGIVELHCIAQIEIPFEVFNIIFGHYHVESAGARICPHTQAGRPPAAASCPSLKFLFNFGIADSGRVKVFVRVRPPRPHESSRKELIAVNVQELSSQVSFKKNATAR